MSGVKFISLQVLAEGAFSKAPSDIIIRVLVEPGKIGHDTPCSRIWQLISVVEENRFMFRHFLSLALVAFLFLANGCSEGGSVAPANYTGDAISDFTAAVQAGDVAKVTELLKVDSSLLELRDEAGQSALHYAALANKPAMVELLIEQGIDPNVKDNEGRTPLTVVEDSNLRLDAARDALKDNGGTN